MATSNTQGERAKYGYLLRLCQEQIRVVTDGDMMTLDRIMAAKKAIIGNLIDPQGLMKRDPSVIEVIDQIKAAEKETQRILQERMDAVKLKLHRFNQQQRARRAYRRYPAVIHSAGFAIDQYTPRFIDRAS
jgi:hypothetical protein